MALPEVRCDGESPFTVAACHGGRAAAICAAPIVLARAGRLAGRQQLPPEVALWYQYHNYPRLNVYTGSWIESGPVGLLLLLVFLAMPLGPVLWSLRRGIRLETAAVAAGYCTLLIGLNATEMLQFVFFLFWGMTAAAGLHELSSQRKQITDES